MDNEVGKKKSFSEELESIKQNTLLSLEEGTDYIQKKIIGRGYKQIFKDIEINQKEFLLLLLISISTSTFGAISLTYSGNLINTASYLGGTGLGSGIIIGLILSFLFIDKIKTKFSVLAFLYLAGSALNTIGIVISFFFDEVTFPIIIFSLNAIIFVLALNISITTFISYTTMLERGRTIAIILLLDLLYLAVIAFLVELTSFAFILNIVTVLIAIFLIKNKKSEKDYAHFTLFDLENQVSFPEISEKEIENEIEKSQKNSKEIEKITEEERNRIRERILKQKKETSFLKFLIADNRVIIKYLFVIFSISMLVSLMIPEEFYSGIIRQSGREIYIPRDIIFIGVIFLIAGSFIIGLVFDFYGRKMAITILLLVISIANFVSLFQSGDLYTTNQLSLISAVVFSLILSIVLIIGELGRAEFYARSITLFLLIPILGFGLGAIIKNKTISDLLVLYPEIENEFFSEIRDFTSAIIFMLCILALFIMANINSPQTVEEQNWPESLLHLYIIHNSGLLLYEHNFKDEESFVTADLVSGGLIGLTTMLQEITKDKQKLRIIDHGNKKLLFNWSQDDQVVFVLVINRELVVLRHKLFQLGRAFDDKFSNQMKDFKGVNTAMYEKICKNLVHLFFTRKYFDLIPGLLS